MNRAHSVLALPFFLLACGPDGVTARQAGLRGGDPRPWAGQRATVHLGACSAVLLSRHTLATAEHCLPQVQDGNGTRAADEVVLAVRGGPDGGECLTERRGDRCAAWPLRVVVQPGSDIALLQSAAPLQVSAGDAARIGLGRAPARVRVQGYGEGDGAAFTRSLSAEFSVHQADRAFLYGRAPADVGVCGGDSGGPVFRPEDEAVVLGILSGSQPDPRQPSCTAPGGVQRWGRLDPEFLARHAGPCQVRGDVLDCSGGGVLSPDVARAAARPASREDLVALLGQARRPGGCVPLGRSAHVRTVSYFADK